ncbi:hypothetical protein C2845_PM02G27510 [Panicum miliaceum]|uniref:Uncharacterized protein n=1 Tax=Panicum miliaceum TaxID=4540 RepID=A0A3L6S7V4_PANMI|nr:hypothetical protein C2845_PM02G27510 [Panicum miliaceum]
MGLCSKDGSKVQINRYSHQCASRSRVLGTMAYQAWIAERTIPLLKKKPGIGSKEVQTILQDKYKIEINYQTVWYGRQRAADKLFGKWDDSFDWLYRFKTEIELRAPGSVVEIVTVTIDGHTLRAVYNSGWPNITDRNQWPEVDKGFKLYPPLGKKRVVGRQRKNRIPSCLERSGKAIRQVKCDGCGEKGHRRGSWKCHLTGKKRGKKSTKKKTVEAGRKKAKMDTTTEHDASKEATTPRTRAAVAREKAQAAAREAEAAQATARHAAEVAEAVAREAEGENQSVVARKAAAMGPDVAQATKTLGPTTRRRLAMETTPTEIATKEDDSKKKAIGYKAN